jgi:hypothetical protein
MREGGKEKGVSSTKNEEAKGTRLPALPGAASAGVSLVRVHLLVAYIATTATWPEW